MTASIRPGEPSTAPEARLVIAEHLNRRGNLSGGWWPRSRFAAQELPPLLNAARRRFRSVLGLTLTLAEWPGSEIAVRYCGPRTKLSWYGLPTCDLAVLHIDGGRRVNLLVVPPSTPEDVAVGAMLMACAPGTVRTPEQVLGDAMRAVLPETQR